MVKDINQDKYRYCLYFKTLGTQHQCYYYVVSILPNSFRLFFLLLPFQEIETWFYFWLKEAVNVTSVNQ